MTSQAFELLKQKKLLINTQYPVEIEFLRVTTKIDNRRTRRGNYQFEVTVQEQVGQNTIPFIFNVNIQPNQPDYYIQNTFTTNNEAFIETGDSLEAYMIKNASELIQEEKFIKDGVIQRMKKAIIFSLSNIEHWNRNGGGIVTHTFPKIGKIVIQPIGRVTDNLDNHF